jgi:hypothetical protein
MEVTYSLYKYNEYLIVRQAGCVMGRVVLSQICFEFALLVEFVLNECVYHA